MKFNTQLRTSRRILSTLVLIASAWQLPTARANLTQFEVSNRTNDDFGFAVKVNDVWQYFSFDDVVVEFDTTLGSTGQATISGDMSFNTNGEGWTIDATFDNIVAVPAGRFPRQAVPYDKMLHDLAREGVGSDAILAWMDIALELTPSLNNTNPQYTGPMEFVTRSNVQVTGMSHPSILKFEEELTPPEILFDIGAWFETAVNAPPFGDTHFNFVFIVPEPSTCVLVWMGLLCGVFSRRRYPSERNPQQH